MRGGGTADDNMWLSFGGSDARVNVKDLSVIARRSVLSVLKETHRAQWMQQQREAAAAAAAAGALRDAVMDPRALPNLASSWAFAGLVGQQRADEEAAAALGGGAWRWWWPSLA